MPHTSNSTTSTLPPLDSLRQIERACETKTVDSLVLRAADVEATPVAQTSAFAVIGTAESVRDALNLVSADDRSGAEKLLHGAISDPPTALVSLAGMMSLSTLLVHEVAHLTREQPKR